MLRLEDGNSYEVKTISIFHTSFKTESNTLMIRNNSLLMILNYGFKEFNAGHNRGSHKFSFAKLNDLQYKKDADDELNKI